ncbi:MFS transporter [Arachidicoccus terrestris]|uniref:MFS transporter n=1 Tax=Arachidicoccus terrestris TaxID=2875539 RepID=UPI001CC7BF9D|nr:MFS transporter [Arachidicoccus terrestris]UAY53936.1 MFS transporter [Arachidicoccus terrestris]
MRQIVESNSRASTIIAFVLIPLSGLATDVYIPSLPDMASAFHVGSVSIQQTLILFLISYGVAQFFAGSILDSFGRYRIGLISLFVFTISNFFIIHAHSLEMVYAMRIVQGISTAFIVVGKRAFFVDVFTGEKQKHYTSLLTIVWATAPITAPFLGGFLQSSFGWTSNFYLLGIYSGLMLILELIYGGETLRYPVAFKGKKIVDVYKKLIGTFDFSFGILVLGLSYSIVMVFGMSVPFIVEHKYHLSPVVTGYCALLSGTALLFGGVIGKALKKGSIPVNASKANLLQLGLIFLMMISSSLFNQLPLTMVFVVLIHLMVGLVYNLFFTYCLTRFPKNAGMASGITSGGSYMVTSVFSTVVLAIIHVTNEQSLALCYLTLAVLAAVTLLAIRLRTGASGKKLALLKAK